MSWVLASLVVVGFAAVLEGLHLPHYAREVGHRARESLAVLRDESLEDREKERRMQRQALRLFALLAILVGGSLAAIGLPLLVVWILEQGGISSLGAVLEVLERWDFLAGATVVGGAAYWAFSRLRGS